MEEVEEQVVKNMKVFCKSLPLHVDNWRNLLMECKKSIVPLSNLSEQLRHVERAKLDYMENFETTQKNLQFSILSCIEEDLLVLKRSMEQLNKINHDFRSKLTNFETSTINLDWTSNTDLIRGSSVQPRLEKLLELSYDYSQYFNRALKNINSNFKTMNVRDEKSMINLEKSFQIDLDVDVVNDLLAITQYIDNEHLIN